MNYTSTIVLAAVLLLSATGGPPLAAASEPNSEGAAFQQQESSRPSAPAEPQVDPFEVAGALQELFASPLGPAEREALWNTLRELGVPLPPAITRYSVDGGAASLSGDTFHLWGIAGQPDTRLIQGGAFAIRGGFLSPREVPFFSDGFETGDCTAWSVVLGGCPSAN